MRYLLILLRHKWYVLVEGRRLGGIPLWRLLAHDISKHFLVEFRAYEKRFVHGNCPQEEWDMAWLKHQHRNSHHWQHWVMKGIKPLPMPEACVREMVADWLAASRYKGGVGIREWLAVEYRKMILHDLTIARLEKVLASIGIQLPPRVS